MGFPGPCVGTFANEIPPQHDRSGLKVDPAEGSPCLHINYLGSPARGIKGFVTPWERRPDGIASRETTLMRDHVTIRIGISAISRSIDRSIDRSEHPLGSGNPPEADAGANQHSASRFSWFLPFLFHFVISCAFFIGGHVKLDCSKRDGVPFHENIARDKRELHQRE